MRSVLLDRARGGMVQGLPRAVNELRDPAGAKYGRNAGMEMERYETVSIPARDTDPAEIKPLLPYLLLTELLHDPLRVRFRLIGTRIVEAAKTDLTGQWLHEADLDGNNSIWNEVYRRVIETRAPVFGQTRATVRPGDVHLFQLVVLPLSDDGETVNRTVELEDWEMLRRLSKADVDAAEWRLEPLV